MPQAPTLNGPPGNDGISSVAFSRFKYGREVCVDARPIISWTGVDPTIKTHRLDFHEFLFVDHGRGTVWIDDRRQLVAGPTIIVTAPGQVRRVEAERPFDGRLVVFTQDVRERLGAAALWRDSRAISVCRDVPAETRVRVGVVTAAMQREVSEGHPDMPAMLEALLAQLVLLLGRLGSRLPAVRREPRVLVRLRQLVEQQYRIEHRASAYADALGISLDHLSAIARRHGYGSVKTIIQARIHDEARRLLLHTDMTVAEIGFLLGYSEPGHFGRAFRHIVGVAPSCFRAHISEKYR
jgi:AraC family transcriptional activator of pobA